MTDESEKPREASAAGRVVAYELMGVPQGAPVIFLHGTPGSRLQLRRDDIDDLGVSVAAVDRPGYGRSDPSNGLTEAAATLAAVADDLGWPEFSILAMSGGAPHALATAAQMSDRVRSIALLCPLGPLDRAGAFDGMAASVATSFRLAATGDLDALVAALKPTADAITHDAEAFVRLGFNGPDSTVRALASSVREAVLSGPIGWARDLQTLAASWPFYAEMVACSVRIWHGDKDVNVPLHHSQWLAEVIPNATLEAVPNAEHLDTALRTHEALTALRDAAS